MGMEAVATSTEVHCNGVRRADGAATVLAGASELARYDCDESLQWISLFKIEIISKACGSNPTLLVHLAINT